MTKIYQTQYNDYFAAMKVDGTYYKISPIYLEIDSVKRYIKGKVFDIVDVEAFNWDIADKIGDQVYD